MFIHNINPVLVNLGPFEIRYYGLVYVIGFLLAYFILKILAKNGKIKNINSRKVDDLIIYLIIGVIVGARIFEILFYEPAFYFSNPLEMFMIWHGGLSFHGGLVGIIIATLFFCKKNKVKFYDLADVLVIPAALMLGFGRIANFINGELWGTITNVPWCVKFQGVEGCRHPSQIYEALKNFFIFFVLIFLNKNKAKYKLKKGTIFWIFVLLYGILRFITNFWRDDPRILGISMGQFLSLIMIVVAAVFLWKIRRERMKEKSAK